MSPTPAFSHVSSTEDNSKTLLGQTPAVIVGFCLTVGFGLPLTIFALGKVFDALGHLVVFLIAAYVVALVVQFWVAKSYKNGMTKKELLYAVLWPLDVIRSIRRGLRVAAGEYPGTTHESDDDGEKVLNESSAFVLGCGTTILAITMLISGVFAALAVIGAVFWFALAAWAVGAIVQFWVAESWRDGLTVNELVRAIVWPLGMAQIIRAGAKRFQHKTQQA